MSRIIASAAIRGAHEYVSEAEAKLTASPRVVRWSDAPGVPQHGLLPAADPRAHRPRGEDRRGGPGTAADRPRPARPRPHRRDLAALPGRHAGRGHRHAGRRGDHRGPQVPRRGRYAADAIVPRVHRRRHPPQSGHQAGGRPHAGIRRVRRRPADQREAVALARELQEKNILVFMAEQQRPEHGRAARRGRHGDGLGHLPGALRQGHERGRVRAQLRRPVGDDLRRHRSRATWPRRARSCSTTRTASSRSCWRRLGRKPVDTAHRQKYATAAGAINFGFPVIADSAIPQILPQRHLHLRARRVQRPLDRIVPKAIEVRGLKLKVIEDPHPGRLRRRVRGRARPQGEPARGVRQQVLTPRSSTCADCRWIDEVEDGKVTVVGPDIDTVEPGKAHAAGHLVEVAGPKLPRGFRERAGAPHPPVRQLRRSASCTSASGTSPGSASARKPTTRASG